MKPVDNTWAILNENALRKAVAAWHLLHAPMSRRGHGLPDDTKIGDALMSKCVPQCVILKHRPTAMVVASSGKRLWGALGLPLRQVNSDDESDVGGGFY